MIIFACVLLVANVAGFVLVLASQRVTRPICGQCGGALAPTDQRVCETCGGDLLKVGITAGCVMRPPRRGVLLALAVVLVVSLTPLFMLLLENELVNMKNNGPGYRDNGAVYGFTNRSPLATRDTKIKLNLRESMASGAFNNPGFNVVTQAEVELTRVPPEEARVPALEKIVFQGGSESYQYPSRADVLKWLQQEKIFLDTSEGDAALQRSAEHIYSQMIGMSNGSFSTGFDMNAVSSQSTGGQFPIPTWALITGWVVLVLTEVFLLIMGVVLVLRFTRPRQIT